MTGIGERINARRKELGMTQEELSKKLGYKNKSTISETITSVRNVPERNEKGRRCGSRMLTRKNTDSALQRSKTTNRAAALPETVTRGRRTAAG